jgi:hypothetical protein
MNPNSSCRVRLRPVEHGVEVVAAIQLPKGRIESAAERRGDHTDPARASSRRWGACRPTRPRGRRPRGGERRWRRPQLLGAGKLAPDQPDDQGRRGLGIGQRRRSNVAAAIQQGNAQRCSSCYACQQRSPAIARLRELVQPQRHGRDGAHARTASAAWTRTRASVAAFAPAPPRACATGTPARTRSSSSAKVARPGSPPQTARRRCRPGTRQP